MREQTVSDPGLLCDRVYFACIACKHGIIYSNMYRRFSRSVVYLNKQHKFEMLFVITTQVSAHALGHLNFPFNFDTISIYSLRVQLPLDPTEAY